MVHGGVFLIKDYSASDDAGKLKSTELPGTLTRFINGVPKIITFGGKRYECIKNHEGKIQAYD